MSSSKRKSQPTRIAEDQICSSMFPTFPNFKPNSPFAGTTEKAPDSDSDIERLKVLQQECLQSLLLQQQQHQLQQSLSQLNQFSSLDQPGFMQQSQKSMQDTLKCLKSLQLARSLDNETPRYFLTDCMQFKHIIYDIFQRSDSENSLSSEPASQFLAISKLPQFNGLHDTSSSMEKDSNKNNLLLAMLWLQRHRELMSRSQQTDSTFKVSSISLYIHSPYNHLRDSRSSHIYSQCL